MTIKFIINENYNLVTSFYLLSLKNYFFSDNHIFSILKIIFSTIFIACYKIPVLVTTFAFVTEYSLLNLYILIVHESSFIYNLQATRYRRTQSRTRHFIIRR